MGIKSKIIHILKHTRFDKGVTDEDIADGIVMIKGGMMKNWRPDEGWHKRRADYLNHNTLLAITGENKATYEAGADAVLEALKKWGDGACYEHHKGTNIINLWLKHECEECWQDLTEGG